MTCTFHDDSRFKKKSEIALNFSGFSFRFYNVARNAYCSVQLPIR